MKCLDTNVKCLAFEECANYNQGDVPGNTQEEDM